MTSKKGKISVTTEDIFPIIRQWLYSSKDIFIRELISNAADAITKRKRLADLGETEPFTTVPEIHLSFDPTARTLIFSDNGVGMTGDEVEKYINQIAYSGLVDFVEKYHQGDQESNSIIGHFGLGFYSSFMVAEQVEIDTRSCLPGAQPIHWQSEEGIEFEMKPGQRETIGTDIILHLSDDAMNEIDAAYCRRTLAKYGQFMPYAIYFHEQTEAAEKASDDVSEQEEKRAEMINNTDPLWNAKPADVTDEQYREFYREAFPGGQEPLFWIHLNLDYPFRLKGILYFPRTDNIYENLDGRIKIYYNQVFVADNVPEIIPDFLFLLQGCIDCPDLPLNVSRSFLQDDQYVRKLSSHIVRKVADRLKEAFKQDRAQFSDWWKHLSVFVKYGMMREEKFFERAKNIILFKTTQADYLTLEELGDQTVLYTNSEHALASYVHMAEEAGRPVVIMDHEIDQQWMSFLEFKTSGKTRFSRVDSELTTTDTQDSLTEAQKNDLTALFRKISENTSLTCEFSGVGEKQLPLLFREQEEIRRMREMREQLLRNADPKTVENLLKMDPIPGEEIILVINLDHPAITDLLTGEETVRQDLGDYYYQLAKLGQGELKGQDLIRFLEKSATYAQQATREGNGKDTDESK